MALSGMNRPEQLDGNLAAAESAQAGGLNADELALFAEVREFFRAKMTVTCTTCGYCLPCPAGVAIPDVFSNRNTSAMFDARRVASVVYRMWVMGGGHGADQCTHCGECEPKCPQKIPIIEQLKETDAALGKGAKK